MDASESAAECQTVSAACLQLDCEELLAFFSAVGKTANVVLKTDDSSARLYVYTCECVCLCMCVRVCVCPQSDSSTLHHVRVGGDGRHGQDPSVELPETTERRYSRGAKQEAGQQGVCV